MTTDQPLDTRCRPSGRTRDRGSQFRLAALIVIMDDSGAALLIEFQAKSQP